MTDSPLIPLEEQTGPPPLVEDFHDTDDFPEGEQVPDQSPVPDSEGGVA